MKYICIIGVLSGFFCVIFFFLWQSSQKDVFILQDEKIALNNEIVFYKSELKRRDENAKQVADRKSEIEKVVQDVAYDWGNTVVDPNVLQLLQRQCVSCK